MSVAAPERAVPVPVPPPGRHPLLTLVAREAPVLWAGALLAALVLVGLGVAVSADSWLALLGGRQVARGGPPTVDTLATWTAGRRWVDQQWLAQWGLHAAWRLGGLRGLGVLHSVTVLAAYAGVLVGARRRGGSSAATALVGVLGVIPFFQVAGNIRPQGFALVLWTAVLWLTCAHVRRPARRVLWVLPVLVLWANVHGSAVLGAGLVVLAGLFELATAAHRSGGARGRALVLVLLSPLTLLATPYGTGVFGYLRDLLGNAEIARVASDWQPTRVGVAAAPFLLLGLLGAVLVVRRRGALTAFEHLVLAGSFAAALAAQRNLGWFALTAVLLLPAVATDGWRGPGRLRIPQRFAEPLGVMALAATVLAGAVGLARMPGVVHHRYPATVAAQVARAARAPGLVLWAHPAYADWLMLTEPSLVGRVPFDIRFELLSEGELRRFVAVRDQVGPGWRGALGRARLVVYDRSDRPSGGGPPASTLLLREPGARQLAAAGDAVAVLRP